MDVGKNIKQLRELKNYSQTYMAQQLGISQRQYSNIESNVNNITISQVEKIATILNISISKILELNAETIFNNQSHDSSILNNQVFHNGLADKERLLYEKLLTEKDLRISALEQMINK